MTDIGYVRTAPAADESAGSAVHWGAVLAGTVTSSAFALTLVALGTGIGLMSVSPWSNSGVSTTTFGVLTLAWLAAIQLFAFGIGGYISGRLRVRWPGTHTDEVFFRDTAHGLLVWALGTLVSVAILATTAASVVSGAAQTGATVAKGAASSISSAAGAVAQNSDAQGYFNDMLFRADHPAAGNDASSKPEVARIFFKAVADGEISPADKTYAGQVVARETGLSQPDAEKRVTDVLAQAEAAKAKIADMAKKAADAARKTAVYLALWTFVSLLIGAFAACFMATVGGRIRDDLPAIG